MTGDFSLRGMTVVTPSEVKKNGSIAVSEGRIKEFSETASRHYTLDKHYILFPALVNSHDHLFGTYFPKIGKGPYVCWLPWDYDLKSSEIYLERNKNTPLDIYQLGAYKNLISGVTTVHDHIPHEVNDQYIDKLPIRVIRDYTLAHEVSSYDLKWGEGIEKEYKKAVQNDIPFITHIEEGFDEESLRGVDILEKHGALSEHTVLIHGVGFSSRDIQLLAERKVNFVWCPGSNMYMFGKTTKIKQLLEAGVNISIGTDSPASGELNILEEIRFAKKVYRELYDQELSDKQIVEMITINPAKALRLQDRLGSLEKGKLADLLVISGDRSSPYSSLVNAQLKDIALLFMNGRPIYGDTDFKPLFKEMGSKLNRITIQGKEKLICGDPESLMKKLRKNVKFNKELPFLPI